MAEAAEKVAVARLARATPKPWAPEPPPLSDEDAATMFAVLEHHHVAYAVIGGMAAAL